MGRARERMNSSHLHHRSKTSSDSTKSLVYRVALVLDSSSRKKTQSKQCTQSVERPKSGSPWETDKHAH